MRRHQKLFQKELQIKLILISLCLCSFILSALSQSSNESLKPHSRISPYENLYGLKLGTGRKGFEIGVLLMRTQGKDRPSYSFVLSNEFIKDKSAFNPKFGMEAYYYFFGARLSLIDYIVDKKHDFRLRPEIGLTAYGFINLYIGMDFFFNSTPSEIDQHGKNRMLFLSLNLPLNSKRVWR